MQQSQEEANITHQDVEASISYGWLIGSLLVGLIILKMIQTIVRLRRQISKASDITGYWQLLAEGLMPFPILSPYIAHGNFHVIQQLIAKELDRVKKLGSGETQYAIRVSTPYRNNILLWDKDSVKEVLVSKSTSFPKPLDFYEPFNIFNKDATSILTSPDGPVWKKHHHIVAPSFSTGNLIYMSQVALTATDALFRTKWNRLLEKDSNGFVLDLEDMTEVTLEIIGQAGFGLDFGIFKEANEEGKKFREALTTVIKYDYYLRFFLGKIPFLYSIASKYTGNAEALKVMSEKLEQCIEQRVAEFKEDPEKPMNDLLSQLVKANMLEEKLSIDELKSNAYIFVIAGHETTATTLQWLMYELSKRPEAQSKAREEAIRIGEGEGVLRAPTFDDYNSMDYIHGCIMECLRLHPPVIAMVKNCVKTTKIGKNTIPKGSCIYVHAKACHLYGPDFNTPEFKGSDFAPERFLDKDFKQRVQTSGAWFPFNMSNRKCIGYMFSQIETCIILCRMLQFYEFKLLNDETKVEEQITDVPGITFRPSSNLRVLVTRRK